MENPLKNPFRDTIWVLGFIFLLVSAILFIIPVQFSTTRNAGWFFGLFSLHFMLCAGYGLILLISGVVRFGWRVGRNSIGYSLLWLNLFLISAYALNREMSVFQDSADWLCAALVAAVVASTAHSFQHYFSEWVRILLTLVLAASALLFLYLAIYLLPLYALSAVAFFVLGISLHTFVPLWFVIYLTVILRRAWRESLAQRVSILVGVLLPIGLAVYFTLQWNQAVEKTEAVLQAQPSQQLPAWVRLSQQLDRDWVTERMLKADVVYEIPQRAFGMWSMPEFRSFSDVRKHDPLIIVTSYFVPGPDLLPEDRIKILEVQYDARHQAQERLWSGKNLQTAEVVTKAEIHPDYRLAYTEKTLTIHHNGSKDSWRPEQEAIYTFHLPEGSVVTSLSLWINGREEPAYLTTKSKADLAYKTIVGVEVRDPSVVHWQEGNTVSVRVFPCTPTEDRQFKIGITSPLRKEKDQLLYENIYFQGPDFSGATENTEVKIIKSKSDTPINLPVSKQSDQTHHYRGHYRSDWRIHCKASPVANGTFSFNGHTYHAIESRPEYESFQSQAIYLDLNAAWTDEEFQSVWEAVKGSPVYVYKNGFTTLTDSNRFSYYAQLTQQQFSLFPLHLLPNPEKSLIITKSGPPTPNLNDLKGTPFYESAMGFMSKKQPVRVLHLGPHLSPYLKTLKEFRTISVATVTEAEVRSMLSQKQFIRSAETPESVEIGQAGMQIRETEGTMPGNAPDHLFRLYAYNTVMRKLGGDYAEPDTLRMDLVEEAQKAYVVTPLSSLVVLERQQDYERFDIKESQNSLKNASLQSSGSVPEPHEWMLIILTVIVITGFWLKSYLR